MLSWNRIGSLADRRVRADQWLTIGTPLAGLVNPTTIPILFVAAHAWGSECHCCVLDSDYCLNIAAEYCLWGLADSQCQVTTHYPPLTSVGVRQAAAAEQFYPCCPKAAWWG